MAPSFLEAQKFVEIGRGRRTGVPSLLMTDGVLISIEF
jgi:hypothetical protein